MLRVSGSKRPYYGYGARDRARKRKYVAMHNVGLLREAKFTNIDKEADLLKK
jgi:hypothetical protein